MASFPTIRVLTVTLLIGTAVAAPSILALDYANYSNRGDLLVRTKGLQLVVFLVLSAGADPSIGPVGRGDCGRRQRIAGPVRRARDAIILADAAASVPARRFLAAMMTGVTLAGWALGTAIRLAIPLAGPLRFFVECALWLAVVAVAASPLAIESVRGEVDSRRSLGINAVSPACRIRYCP